MSRLPIDYRPTAAQAPVLCMGVPLYITFLHTDTDRLIKGLVKIQVIDLGLLD